MLAGEALAERKGAVGWAIVGVGAAIATAGATATGVGTASVAIGAGGTTGEVAAAASMGPVPAKSHGKEMSGNALMIFCTTSKLGLLRSLRI